MERIARIKDAILSSQATRGFVMRLKKCSWIRA